MTVNTRTIAIIAAVSVLAVFIVGFVAIAYTPFPIATAKATNMDLSEFKVEKIGSSNLGENILGRLRALGATDSSLTTNTLPAKADSKTIFLFQDTNLLREKRGDPEFQVKLKQFMYERNAKFIMVNEKSSDVTEFAKQIGAQGVPADAKAVGQFIRPLDAVCSIGESKSQVYCGGAGSTWSYTENGDAASIMESMQEWLGKESQLS